MAIIASNVSTTVDTYNQHGMSWQKNAVPYASDTTSTNARNAGSASIEIVIIHYQEQHPALNLLDTRQPCRLRPHHLHRRTFANEVDDKSHPGRNKTKACPGSGKRKRQIENQEYHFSRPNSSLRNTADPQKAEQLRRLLTDSLERRQRWLGANGRLDPGWFERVAGLLDPRAGKCTCAATTL